MINAEDAKSMAAVGVSLMRAWRLSAVVAGLAPLLLLARGADADAVRKVTADSSEGRTIVEAALPPVVRDLGRRVTLDVENLNLSGDWAFVRGRAKPIPGELADDSRNIYRDRWKEGPFSNEAAVLLVKNGGGWKVVTYSFGFTTPVWQDWDEEFGAPAGLWPK